MIVYGSQNLWIIRLDVDIEPKYVYHNGTVLMYVMCVLDWDCES